jgi:hypothetical protein
VPLGGAKEDFLGGGILERGRSALGLFGATPLRPRMNARRGCSGMWILVGREGCEWLYAICVLSRDYRANRRLASVASVACTVQNADAGELAGGDVKVES